MHIWLVTRNYYPQIQTSLKKRTPKCDGNHASVTGNTEEEENAAEQTYDNADENEEANEINIKNKDNVVTIKEEKKTLEYQKTMNLDIETIASANQQFWKSIYEVIDYSYFKVVEFFPTKILDKCKKSSN